MDLTPDEFDRLARMFPLLTLREKLAVTKYARANSGHAMGLKPARTPIDPRTIT